MLLAISPSMWAFDQPQHPGHQHGRMVETISVGDNGDNILMSRPYLLKEERNLPSLLGNNAKDELAYLNQDEAEQFCQTQGSNWRTPTACMTA